jgi:hypothetical protein
MTDSTRLEPSQYASITRESPIIPGHLSKTRSNGRLERSTTGESRKSTFRDPDLDVNLPYRTLSAAANLKEYTIEEPSGAIEGPPAEDGTKRKLVTFVPNDPENPKNWSKVFKWYCTVGGVYLSALMHS